MRVVTNQWQGFSSEKLIKQRNTAVEQRNAMHSEGALFPFKTTAGAVFTVKLRLSLEHMLSRYRENVNSLSDANSQGR